MKLMLLLLWVVLPVLPRPAHPEEPVQFTVDLNGAGLPWRPTWNWFGADEPNYLTTQAGRALLGELGKLSPGTPVYFRPHNLLTSGDGTPGLKWGSTGVYTEDASGKPAYHWELTDGIFDAMVQAGVTPFVEVGFMPEALSTHPEPYRHSFPQGDVFTGWSYPPKDYGKWAALVAAWAGHLRERYGQQVSRWRWEVWNEPDIKYWHGTEQEYFELYDLTVAAVRKAVPGAVVGGPATTGPYGDNTFLQDFLAHCAKEHAPLDFISFHPKGSPHLVDAAGKKVKKPGPDTHVELGIGNQLSAIRNGFAIVSQSEFKQLPVILSESDPEGCAACRGPANAYRNGEAYAASVLEATAGALALAREYGVQLEGAVNWAFVFPGQAPFAGFRELATAVPGAGAPIVDKPVMNALRLLGMLHGDELPAAGVLPVDGLLGAGPHEEVRALAVRRDAGEVDVLVWRYSDSLASGPALPFALEMQDLPASGVHVEEVPLDGDHGDAYSAWVRMGSPAEPSVGQARALVSVSRLREEKKVARVLFSTAGKQSEAMVQGRLSRNGAVLIIFKFH